MELTKRNNLQLPQVGARQIRLLEKLSQACAVSGNEDAVREIVLEQLKPLKVEVEVDPVGNVLVTGSGKGNNLPRVMLAAHMDEVGFMLTQEDGDGLFRFEIVGGIDEHQLAGKPVWVGKKRIPGVIGAKPIHLTTDAELKNPLKAEGMRIDIGPANKGKAKPGEWAAFATKLARLGPSLFGKALDDRIGVVSLLTLLENPPGNINLMAAFTVQEEVGLRGAYVAAHRMAPDLAVVLDCTPAMDMPMWDSSENTQYRTRLDHGPAIYVADSSTLSDPRLINLFKSAAELHQIPYQLRQPGGGGTDAGSIHKQRSVIPSISISVPGRYLHTPASIVRLNDWKNSIALAYAGLSYINDATAKKAR
jgi:putative aminopeptidase FrvX